MAVHYLRKTPLKYIFEALFDRSIVSCIFALLGAAIEEVC